MHGSGAEGVQTVWTPPGSNVELPTQGVVAEGPDCLLNAPTGWQGRDLSATPASDPIDLGAATAKTTCCRCSYGAVDPWPTVVFAWEALLAPGLQVLDLAEDLTGGTCRPEAEGRQLPVGP